MTESAKSASHPLIIIGSGFGGLGMAIALKKSGVHDFLILEKGADVGGTWRENTYPGAACDVPSHMYSFSFEPNPAWSRKYAPQPEILRYLRHCADKYGLRAHLRCNTEVTDCTYHPDGHWQVRTANGETLHGRALITACGQLNRPAWVKAPGIETFKGVQFHSALWNHDYDLQGKRVAVIGTGASAIQFIPPVVQKVAALTVFQRTPPYVIPRSDRAYLGLEKWLFAHVPGARLGLRAGTYGYLEMLFEALIGNRTVMKVVQWHARRHFEKQVTNPELRARLTPDYPLGCKRILISDDYYPALAQPHVEVVTQAVRQVTATGVITQDGREYPVDAIIHGTGFAATDFLAPMRITGRDGLDLNRAWQDGAEAHMGVSVAGFPNFFMLYGPNTNLGHNSIVFMLESQIAYTLSALRALQARAARAIDVRPAPQRAYNAEMQSRLAGAVWAGNCHSWYINAAGKNTNNWPGHTWEYRRRTRQINPDDYEFLPA